MKVNSIGNFSRSSSARSSRKSNVVLPKSSYSSPTPGSAPRSPSLNYHCTVEPPQQPCYDQPKSPSHSEQKSPSYQRSPQSERNCLVGQKSPKVQLSSPNQSEREVFDFIQSSAANPRSPILPPRSPRSPRSPRAFNYDTDMIDIASSSDCDSFNFNLQSPPKPKLSKMLHRQQYQSSKSDSNNSKSSLEYQSTTKHPTGAYQDIEYKICHSLDSDSQTNSSYRYSTSSSRHSSFKEKTAKKPRCNIRTNPGYDERYASSKSINSSDRPEKPIQRCRKSTSDLTDMTDDAANTTMTSLSRPSSPRRKGSVKGGLAYLASRRGSRDSIASNMSNLSNEDIGPLNFQNTARGRQRRTSNFLELPGTWRNSSVGIKNYPLKEVKQLLTEIFCLELYRHTNIIPLVAYSFDSRQEAHLVYEYVPGGSLSKRFKTKITQKALSWQQRMKISVGIARGIHYLHTARAKPVVHGDIKAANILLRSDEEPVIGDFGTAHECSRESATENVVGKCKGTLCYLPPEYLQNKLTSTKLDVYGFGVVLLRLATGMPAYLEEYKPPKFLRDVVINYKGDISILTDFRAIGDGKKYFGGLIKVGKACVAKLPKARPDMAVVLSQLEKIYPE